MSIRKTARDWPDADDQGGDARADISRSGRTPNGNKRAFAHWHARTAQGAVWAIALLGMFGIVGGLCWVWRTPETPSAASSGEISTLLETGTTLETEITRTVRPAIERTELLAKDPQVVQLLSAHDRAEQTAWLNEAVTRSTEVDALALFDATGKITAINTRYADGKPISSARVGRILGGLRQPGNYPEMPSQRRQHVGPGVSDPLRHHARIFRFDGAVCRLLSACVRSKGRGEDRRHQCVFDSTG